MLFLKKKCTNRRVKNENEYEVNLERKRIFSSSLRFHIFTSQSHLILLATNPPCLKLTRRARALETSLERNSKIVLVLKFILAVQSHGPQYDSQFEFFFTSKNGLCRLKWKILIIFEVMHLTSKRTEERQGNESILFISFIFLLFCYFPDSIDISGDDS